MASINLSFREWPFLPSSYGIDNSNLRRSSYSVIEIDNFKKKLPSEITQQTSSASLTAQQSDNIRIDSKLINNNHPTYIFSSWGRCGLFACSNESCLSIFSNDKNGNLSPMFMFSPFDVLAIGKIYKQPQKAAFITALAWSDGHLEPSLPKSILAASSEKGYLVVYDFDKKERIGHYLFEDTIISILWCSFKQNRFYAGSRKGHFYICELAGQETIEILTDIEFSKSIDFITQDDVNGHTVGISSKNQTFGFIKNVDKIESVTLQIYQNLKGLRNSDDRINFFQFYPNSQDFVTISTNSTSFLLSISNGTMLPFIQSRRCKFIFFIDNESDKVVVGNDNEINVWQLSGNFWIRKFNLNLGMKEILTFSRHNDKILMVTESNWLTEAMFKRNKIFITKRIKLIDGRIVDFDFGDGSIAFLTSNNNVALTCNTPESIIKPLFRRKSQAIVKLPEDNDKDSQIGNLSEESEQMLSVSDDEDSNSGISMFHVDDTIHGNSNSLAFSFKIDDETFDLESVKWISQSKIVVWSSCSLYLIDLLERTVSEPLSKMFCKKCIQITNVFFSKTRRIMGVVLHRCKAYLFDTQSNLTLMKSFDFSDSINSNKDCLLGSISPLEDKLVFSLSNFLYFTNLKEKGSSTKKVKSFFEFQASFLSWDVKGILVGTENGGALLILNDKIDAIIEKALFGQKSAKVVFSSMNSEKIKLEAVNLIIPCSNERYVIVDSNHKGIIVSKEARIISSMTEVIKQFSKDNFLIKLKNYNRLAVINAFNEFKASLPPSFFLWQEKKSAFIDQIKERLNDNNNKKTDLIEMISDQIFLSNNTDFSLSLRNSVKLLNMLISTEKHFSSISSMNFLKLGNLQEAQDIFLKSSPSDKNYYNNILLAAVYSTSSDAAQAIVKNFLSNNLIDEAVKVLLMKNDVFQAAEILSKNGKNEEAYFVLMLNDQRKDCVEAKEIILEVANSLIGKRENVLFGLKLLSSFGYFREMINYLSMFIS